MLGFFQLLDDGGVLACVQGLRSRFARRGWRRALDSCCDAPPLGGCAGIHGAESSGTMVFEVEAVALELIAVLRPLRERIKGCDRALADQLSRAANSVVLNIGEGNYSDPGNRRARFFTAAGSANETRLVLLNSVRWGFCADADVETALALIKRILAMLWRLTHN